MSKIATIKRAIEKLEQLKLESTKGPWEYDSSGDIDQHWSLLKGDLNRRLMPVVSSLVACGSYCQGGTSRGVVRPVDGDLIVTLHRTVEPQLSLLRLAVKYGELDAGSGSSFIAAAHDLALSIINERAE